METLKKRKRKNAVHYVNNKQFLQDIIKYTKLNKRAIENNLEPPKIPDSIGLAIFNMANHFAHKHNFSYLLFKDDMILDGIESCVRAIRFNKFDPSKSSNPFAYFTQIIFYAFLKRIYIEETQKAIRYKKMRFQLSDEMFELEQEGIDINQLMPDDIHDFIDKYERTKKRSTNKVKTPKTQKNKYINILHTVILDT